MKTDRENVAEYSQLLQLELALTVGRMLKFDLERRCDEFLRTILARKNLAFGSVWLRSDGLRRGGDKNTFEVVSALPLARLRDKSVSVDHPSLEVLSEERFVIIRDSDAEFEPHILESGVTAGCIVLFRLGEQGMLRLHSIDHDCFTIREINQLLGVLEIFTISIEGALSQRRLAEELGERERVENELRESEERFRDFAASSSDWFWEMDADLRFTYMSPNVEDAVGVPAEWHYGKTRADILGDDYDKEAWEGHLRDLKSHKAFRDFTYPRVGDGIESKWLSSSGRPKFSAGGEFLGYRGTGSDVTEQKQREFEIRDSEKNLRQILEESPIGVAIVRHTEIDGQVEAKRLFANDALVKMFGASSQEEIIQADVSETWVDREQLYAVNAAMKDGVNLVDFEAHRLRFDGTELWISMNTRPISFYDQDCTMVWHFDVTNRKRAENALRESEGRFRAFIDNSPAAILLKDTEGRYLIANKQWHEWFNPEGQEIVGKTVFDMYPEAHAIEVTELDRKAMLDEAATATEIKTPFADGAERTTLFLKFPVKLDDGTVIGIGGINTDITERKQAEEALRESEQQLRLVTDSMPVLVTYIDYQEHYRFANKIAEDWLAQPVAHVVGRPIEKVLGPERYAKISAQIKAALTGEMQKFTARITYPDGRERDVDITYVPDIAADGDVAGFFSLAIDITERRALEERLRQAQKMEAVGQLTGGIAHDFNNILAAVIGNLNLVEESPGITDAVDKECIATALRASLRGAELTHRLLAFSRQQDLVAKTTQVNDILPHFCQLAQSTIGEDIAIELKMAFDLWPTIVDAGQLENALLNLAINARDAMPDGGHLTVETANRVLTKADMANWDGLDPGDYVTVTVSDTGTGMPEEVRARVFEPFFTTKDVGEGSGLGLSMVFGFAQQSGGQVYVYSEPDHGTTVRIYLPRDDTAKKTMIAADAGKKERPTGDETILVVEDDGDVRHYLTTILGRLGYTVLAAEHGPEALEVMSGSPPIDLLLTDMILPKGMSGRDVAAAFRERYPDAAVIYSSGYTREALNRRGGLEDDAALMDKPYQTAALAQRIRDALDGRE